MTSFEDAQEAVLSGADVLVAKGAEGGGIIGVDSTFILLQKVTTLEVPVFARGGISEQSAASVLAIGGAGVILDWQLGLANDSRLPSALRENLRRCDGTNIPLQELKDGRSYRALDLEHLHKTSSSLIENPSPDFGTDGRFVAMSLDCTFASQLAAKHKTQLGICAAIRRAAVGSCRRAASARILSDSLLADALDCRFPIIQGPMTRVSDNADFAAAVASAGALPTLALAVMEPDQVDLLCRETSEVIGSRPWGIGVLAFLDRELLETQIERALSHNPSFAVLAGGRPDQARLLEEKGVPAYIHVPSPGLLKLFLDQGARRFIFEEESAVATLGHVRVLFYGNK